MENQAQDQAKLFAKIAKITGELGAIGKDEKHYHGYNYVSADNLRAIMRHKFAEHNLTVIPRVVTTEVDDGWDITTYAFMLCCGDTGAVYEGQFPLKSPMTDAKGKTDDKVSGKAMTYAMKYWMLALFQVSDKDIDDLDKDHEEKAAPPRKNSKQSQSASDGAEDYSYNETQVKVITTKKGDLMYIIGGASMFSRDALRELEYPQFVIDALGGPGELTLPDAVDVKWQQSGDYKNIVSLRRKSNKKTALAS